MGGGGKGGGGLMHFPPDNVRPMGEIFGQTLRTFDFLETFIAIPSLRSNNRSNNEIPLFQVI